MKVIILLVTALAITTHVLCQTDEEVYKIKEKCFDLYDIPIEDRIVYSPENPKLKCFNACSYTGIGMMQNGKIVKEKYIELVDDVLKNATKSDADGFIKHLEDCADIANKQTDECEVAYEMIKCL